MCGRFGGMSRTGRLLLVTDADVNFTKQNLIGLNTVSHKLNQIFLIGTEKHTTSKTVKVTCLGKIHQFLVVPNHFPLTEDGIIGNPYLGRYQYFITTHFRR